MTAQPARLEERGAGKIRAFLAVELDGETRAAAAGTAATLREGVAGRTVRWTRPEAYHVTLRFLGDIHDAEALSERVAAEVAPHTPFDLQLGELMAFPSKRRPRVVVLDVVPHAPLEALAASVERAVVDLSLQESLDEGLDRDGASPRDVRASEQRFRPHLTLGRVRRDAELREAAALFDAEEGGASSLVSATGGPESPVCPVSEVVLFRSDLQPSGAVHTALARMALTGLASHGEARTGEPNDHPDYPDHPDRTLSEERLESSEESSKEK